MEWKCLPNFVAKRLGLLLSSLPLCLRFGSLPQSPPTLDFVGLAGACQGGIAALAAFRYEKTTALAVVLILFIGSLQKIIDADAVEVGKRTENVRRQHPFAAFIICVCALRNIDRFADLALC